jgi:hypothetical protein
MNDIRVENAHTPVPITLSLGTHDRYWYYRLEGFDGWTGPIATPAEANAHARRRWLTRSPS